MKKQYHNYMRDQKNKLRERLDGQEDALKKMAKSKEQNESKYGKYKELIKLGEFDRIKGNNPQVIENEEKQISYTYGYFERGSRALAGELKKGTYSPEEQRFFGINDLNNGLREEHLFNLKDFPNYMNGRIYQMGRNIYNYIEESDITIEEYIHVMSIINENLKNPEFKMGYYSRKEELEKGKRR